MDVARQMAPDGTRPMPPGGLVDRLVKGINQENDEGTFVLGLWSRT